MKSAMKLIAISISAACLLGSMIALFVALYRLLTHPIQLEDDDSTLDWSI